MCDYCVLFEFKINSGYFWRVCVKFLFFWCKDGGEYGLKYEIVFLEVRYGKIYKCYCDWKVNKWWWYFWVSDL